MKILIVEDNPRLADRLKDRLMRSYNVDLVETGHDAIDKAKSIEYGVILLDIGLPDISGSEVCSALREASIHTPILILTGIDENETRVQLLENGADDYVTKPFNTDELKARITALSRRRTQRTMQPLITYDDLTINLDQREVTRANTPIDLRRKEFDILAYLVTNRGRVLTREMILNHAWDSDKVGWSSTVDVHIKHLRDKIDKPFDRPIIKTAYGLGYRVDALN